MAPRRHPSLPPPRGRRDVARTVASLFASRGRDARAVAHRGARRAARAPRAAARRARAPVTGGSGGVGVWAFAAHIGTAVTTDSTYDDVRRRRERGAPGPLCAANAHAPTPPAVTMTAA